MGVLDDVFAGNNGVANLLIDTLGGSAIVETEVGTTYDEAADRTVKDVRRQALPMVVETLSKTNGASAVPNGDSGGLDRNETLFTGTIPTANLATIPRPLKTIVRQGDRRYQAVKVDAVLSGEEIVAYRITMREL